MMLEKELLLRLAVVGFLAFCASSSSVPPSRKHGGVAMGASNSKCDDGESNIFVDWDGDSDYEYECQPDEERIRLTVTPDILSCLSNQDIPDPLHICMNETIEYEDQPPRGGPHRPAWPVYGEYVYLPPQRWVHNLEHGAVVFLYHPCADRKDVRRLKKIVKSCLRRHIITPYRNLPPDQPFALLTYGCKITMSYINEAAVVDFIRKNAMNPNRASEAGVWRNGQYRYGLVAEASIVPGSDVEDTSVCPNSRFK